MTLKDVTASSILTYTHYTKLGKRRGDIKLQRVILSNLIDLEKILFYNIKNNVHFYRITSKLFPLVGHPLVKYNYKKDFSTYLQKIGTIIQNSNMRVDSHPDQFCVLNSIRDDVVKSSISILNYHQNMFKLMQIQDAKVILHIGSSANGKRKSINRFIETFNHLNKNLRTMIIVENDDKIFNIKNTLSLCQKLNIPMVLDYHHHICNGGNYKIEDYIIEIFNTWNNEILKPKVHFSSPKSKKERRSHHDYIDCDEFIEFIERIKFVNRDFDIMIEAKMKDVALFNLIRELKYKTNYKFIDDTTFEI
jgi:UV DNA damage endonuclease